MIKLKDLIMEENGQITPNAIRVYWNFVLNALSGHNPDAFYRQNRADIELIAREMVKRFGPRSGSIVYRGIILDPSEVHNGIVRHVSEITYVSFSEDKRIALAFGDTENPMSEFMRTEYPNKKGYLITKTYDPSLLLYHHTWLEATNMLAFARHTFGANARWIEMQKEVILKPESQYKVEPIEPGSSGGLEVGT